MKSTFVTFSTDIIVDNKIRYCYPSFVVSVELTLQYVWL